MNWPGLLTLLLLLPNSAVRAQAPASGHLEATAHQQSVGAFQQALNKELSDPKESPLSPAERGAFTTLPFYPTNYGYCVTATLVRNSTSQPFAMQTSTGRQPLYRKFGELRFVLNGQALKLSVYQSQELLTRPGLEDYLFVPFTDLTNGRGSYGGGRYLDLPLPAPEAREITLDFNRAYNPFCAYNPDYRCPVPPPENRLSVSILAGEKSFHD